jgi:hypothetical protein
MNSTELVPSGQRPPPAELAGILAADAPAGVIERATEVAKPLAALIDDRKLFVKIKGKRHVTIDGWTTLCAMLACTVREVVVTENDGEFTATVELVESQ